MKGSITGVTRYRNQPFADATVQAFHRAGINSEIYLKEATTNAEGSYQITYDLDQPRDPQKRTINLVVRVFDPDGTLRGEESLPNAPARAQVDVTVTSPVRLSQLERMEVAVRPLRGGVEYRSFTDEDIAFLVRATGTDRTWLIDLRHADQVARETEFPLKVCYGWISKGLSLELDELLTSKASTLRTILDEAINEQIIPPWDRRELDGIMSRFEQLKLERGLLVSREFQGQLVHKVTQEPLAGYTVKALDLEAESAPRAVYDSSDRQGRFSITYRVSSPTPPGENENEGGQVVQRPFRLDILDSAGEEVHQIDLSVNPTEQEVVTIPVPLPPVLRPIDKPVAEVASDIGLEVPNALSSYLAQKGLRSLVDVRRIGGLGRADDLPVAREAEAVQRLDGLANLSVLSSDPKQSDILIKKGFNNLPTIAQLPREDFIDLVGEALGSVEAAKLHVKARAQTQFLGNLFKNFRVEQSNGYKPTSGTGGPVWDDPSFPLENFLSPQFDPDKIVIGPKCACKDCEAAVSPLAYLADLLDYALTHIKNGNVFISLFWLTTTFHQPFGDLPASCEEMDRKVRQVRLCIEVLRRYLASIPLHPTHEAVLSNKESTYRLKTYTTLLRKIGTSYEDLRLAQNVDEETRQKLADRLGIGLELNDLDPLAELLLDPSTPGILTEQALEKLFGLVDTTRDPLSEGAKLGDVQAEITRWNLNGASWKRNTDFRGMVYLTLSSESASEYRVEIHKDEQRSGRQLVASGTRNSAKGSVELKEQNDSGLSGKIDIDYAADNSQIYISAIPVFLSWRLHYLRTLWKRQDWPSDLYTEGVENQLPLIDPDVIGPDDLRNPVPGTPAFDLWLQRRNWVDTQIQSLSSLTTEVNGAQVPDITAMLATMYQEVTYGDFVATPWAPTTLLAEFDTIHNNLNQGIDIESTTVRIETDLHLDVESFTHLMDIRAKDHLAHADSKNAPVTNEEWQDVYSILIQSQKQAMYGEWINEETQNGIQLGPKLFWKSLREPVEGDWPPVPFDDFPRIDPEQVSLKDLPDPIAGKDALALWEARQNILEQIYGDLQAERENSGFDAMLRHAIGHPNSGDPLPPHDLSTLRIDLASNNSIVANDARIKIETDLFMTGDDFTRLMEIKDKSEQTAAALRPKAEEWAEVYAILTSSEKRKRHYASWITEEQQASMDVEYWKALKARLPRWRALAETRTTWQQALQMRSQSPIIDPDVVNPNFFLHPTKGTAYGLWRARNAWINDPDPAKGQLAKLKADREAEATPLDAFILIVDDALGVEATDLAELAKAEEEGHTITARLDQLNLTRKAFSYLIRVYHLLVSNSAVLDSEWNDVYSILLQVKKRREFAEWRAQERALNLFRGPDDFHIPKPAFLQFPRPEPAPLPAWRATSSDRRDWKDTLAARIEQVETTIQALEDIVSQVEEETLPILRDALVGAINKGGTVFENKIKWITDNLLIDAKMDGCQITTRVAQAIETLQGLLWSVRTQQLEDTYPDLTLLAAHFDEEWKWIGSYSDWRSAMFVHLYPENILIPTLHNHLTPTFRRLVAAVRKNRRLTPDDACEAAKEYADYIYDVSHLSIKATCQTQTYLSQDKGCGVATNLSNTSELFHMFAKGPKTEKVYWSTYNPNDNSDYSQSFWDPVSGIENVIDIPGAVAYDMGNNERYIFLFALIFQNGEQKLVISRLDLETGHWDQEPFAELETPCETESIVVVQDWEETHPPRLSFRCLKGDWFIRTVDIRNGDWDVGNDEDLHELKEEYNNEYHIQSEEEWEKYRVRWGDGRRMREKILAVVNNKDVSDNAVLSNSKFLDPGRLLTSDPVAVLHNNIGIPSVPVTFWIGAFHWGGPNYFVLLEDNSQHYGIFTNLYPNIEQTSMAINNNIVRIAPSFGYDPFEGKQLAFEMKGTKRGWYRSSFIARNLLGPTNPIRVAPKATAPFDIGPDVPDSHPFPPRSIVIKQAFEENTDGPESNLMYIREASYYLPMFLALQLQKRGEYVAALDWYRTVYDYSAPVHERKIYYGLVEEESFTVSYERTGDWLRDPLNPHRNAATQRGANTRFTLLSLARCFLEYADSEFTRDTAESLPRARTLYLTALELLNTNELRQQPSGCNDLIIELETKLGEMPGGYVLVGAATDLAGRMSSGQFQAMIEALDASLGTDLSWEQKFDSVSQVLSNTRATFPTPSSMATVVEERLEITKSVRVALLMDEATVVATEEVGRAVAEVFENAQAKYYSPGDIVGEGIDLGDAPFVSNRFNTFNPVSPFNLSGPSYAFCIPPNPVIASYRLHAELNLHKLRTCRNIAGMERTIDPYAAPTDTVTGLPQIGVGGQLVLPGMANFPPTLYRYVALIERAKQLAQLAGQFEAQMLSSLEKRDAEYYNLLKARQDVQISRQGVRLQNLRLKEAVDGVDLAILQRDRSQIQIDTYAKWIEDGLNEHEQSMLDAYEDAESAAITIAITDGLISGGQAAAAAGSSVAGAGGVAAVVAAVVKKGMATGDLLSAEKEARIASVKANIERQKDQWELQQSLAEHDFLIGQQQVRQAEDRERVVGQELKIAQLQNDHAKDTIQYLANKFTNVELYDWMSDILEDAYGFFLQQASATASHAELQLAFERQGAPPAFIQADYWEAPAGMEVSGDPHSGAQDRRGLTGSARLLRDIYQLDQYAFETKQRKLQLSKTISLARLSPVQFQRFRETGVLSFSTPMELFDRDFPGHYLRLIHRFRTSVVALIPPTEGIKATLFTTGLSRVVIGSSLGLFQTIPVRTLPESVALTSPFNATGRFELTPEPQDMRLPFEGMGVDTFWEFRMPKASNLFDFRTIADVLFTIEYTALDSYDKGQQVIHQLDSKMSGDRPFSFRHQFADQWYHLHNPDQTAMPMVVQFLTRREDFPPNIDDLKIQQVILFFSRKDGTTFEVPVDHLHFTPLGGTGVLGGSASSIDGIISTRRGNAGSWISMSGQSPIGQWELALPNSPQFKNRFKDELIQDILFVITYSGRTPEWPK